MIPPITTEQAEQALALLVQLGMLVRDADDRLVQSERVVSTGPETSGVHIVNYHRTMMQRAIESIDLIPRGERDISALTLCVGQPELARIKQRIQEFRRELVGIEGAGGRGDIVLQINFQMYPLTNTAPGEDE
jgi:uncharacterized protein (TIGR02147 family)